MRRLQSTVVRVLPFIGMLVLYALLGLMLWWLLNRYIDPGEAKQPSTAKKDLIQALGFLVAGVAGAVGIYFTQRNLSQTRESTERTLWLTEQGQITERFTRAIEQLGAADEGKPKIKIRLGGIYALERIARDSPERDYGTVMEVLTAYVRENAKRPSSEESTRSAPKPKEAAGQESGIDQGQGDEQGTPPFPRERELPADIRAIIDVIRREKDHIPAQHWVSHDLHETNLEGADLRGADLREADLRETYLFAADLRGAGLVEADLRGAEAGRLGDVGRVDKKVSVAVSNELVFSARLGTDGGAEVAVLTA